MYKRQPRSFTPSNQAMRSLVAKMKLIPNRAMLQGKRILFCDDSIVRGTQLRDNVNVLYDYGAKEVHMRIACPPLIYGCPFIGFTSSKSDMELITRRIIKEICLLYTSSGYCGRRRRCDCSQTFT